MERDFLCLLHIWPVSHHMKLCPDLTWGLSHIVRSALMASTHWSSNWPFLGVSRDRTMQGPLNAKVPDSGACQYGLPPLHLDWMPRRRENFPNVSMWWRVHVFRLYTDTVHCGSWVSFFFHFSLCSLLHTEALFFSQCALCTYCEVHISVYFLWNCTGYFASFLLSVT
jgi:hypothetical protein